ncbi:MAG: T9SS type A sorting domain-containing protein [Bacteroidia bacterium]|nr:T9SS type A sorting domain-containing protein [Bacteroidia bacterium]
MKRLIIIILLVSSTSLYAQFLNNSANVWYFGNRAGIDFNSGTPVALTNGQIDTQEGVATICDTLGNFLFYTDGTTVWDRSNNPMPNGNGTLHGHWSSTQSAIIVPNLGNYNMYYIFTVDELGGANGLQYSLVNMLLPGNGTAANPLGDIVTTEMNIPLVTPVCEKITAVLKASSIDYWVIAHGWNNNNFYLYEVTPMGVNTTPIIQSIGHIHTGGTGNINSVGYMKTSPLQNKLALVDRNYTCIDIYDFNNATGVISNELSIPMLNTTLCGLEFSMSGDYLYMENKDTLFRYKFATGVLTGVTIDDMSVFTTSNIAIRAMQLGPDGKIYVSIRDNNYLSVISNPDDPVTQLTVDGVFLDTDLSGRKCEFGLPTIFYYKGWCYLAAPTINPSDTISICQGDTVTLISSPAYSYLWSDASTDQSVTVTAAGNYAVTISNQVGCVAFSTPTAVQVYTPVIPVITKNGNYLESSSAVTYQWYFNGNLINGATGQQLFLSQAGNYTVQITDNMGCTAISSEFVYLNINEIDDHTNITINRNPANGCFTANIPMTAKEIRVFDVSGKLIINIDTKSRTKIDFRLAEKGVYFLSVYIGNEYCTEKLIVY